MHVTFSRGLRGSVLGFAKKIKTQDLYAFKFLMLSAAQSTIDNEGA